MFEGQRVWSLSEFPSLITLESSSATDFEDSADSSSSVVSKQPAKPTGLKLLEKVEMLSIHQKHGPFASKLKNNHWVTFNNRLITANNHQPPLTTANHRQPPLTTANHANHR
ncbi:hypothetical protein PoB_006018400 [Plakobranchus ocellatus]|uniref:Uncharacterized protein n=1 Tax=Plakobranchus ocellatus TaxID=259542 RepID=A0AAV4CP91_9GAST|nr:hypothetical protein PoB_006018400 [Plakobranchus ocellatus]